MAHLIDEAADYDFIIALVYDRSRIRLHDGKQALIRARLGKRMRHHGLESFHDYCDFLRTRADEDEITHVVDALATNFTGFLRERDHFEFLVREALPKLTTPGRRRINLWSAACATGEEPYTLAFYLAEHYPLSDGWDWQILATDISTKALSKAKDGVYPEDRMGGVPAEWLRHCFQRGHGAWDGHYRVKPMLRERVRFEQINLLGDYHVDREFEVIFCRNVMIYFDRPTQEQLVNHLSRYLMPKGYLLTGHSESLSGLSVGLKCLRPSIYQKA